MIQISDMSRFNLQPGELRLSREPAILETILGSCVGVTFWSERLRVGALCHGVLPRCPEKWPGGSSFPDGYRYVDFCIRYLVKQFDALGANRQELEIKLFGGADVLPVSCVGSSKLTIGAMNCDSARNVLEEEGLTALASDLRGVNGRRIQFHTGTGEVLVRRLGSSANRSSCKR